MAHAEFASASTGGGVGGAVSYDAESSGERGGIWADPLRPTHAEWVRLRDAAATRFEAEAAELRKRLAEALQEAARGQERCRLAQEVGERTQQDLQEKTAEAEGLAQQVHKLEEQLDRLDRQRVAAVEDGNAAREVVRQLREELQVRGAAERDLQWKAAGLEKAIKRWEDDYVQMETKNLEQERQLELLQKERRRLEQEATQHTQRRRQLEETQALVEKLKGQLLENSYGNPELKAELWECRRREVLAGETAHLLEVTKAANEDLRRRLDESRAHAQRLQKEREAAEARLRGRVDAAETEAQRAAEQVAVLQAELSDEGRRRASIRTELEQQRAGKAELQSTARSVEQLRTTVADLEQRKHTLATEATFLRTHLGEARQALHDQQEHVASLNAIVDRLEGERLVLRAENNKLSADLQRALQQLQDAKRAEAAMAAERADFTVRWAQLAADHAAEAAAAAALRLEVEQWESRERSIRHREKLLARKGIVDAVPPRRLSAESSVARDRLMDSQASSPTSQASEAQTTDEDGGPRDPPALRLEVARLRQEVEDWSVQYRTLQEESYSQRAQAAQTQGELEAVIRRLQRGVPLPEKGSDPKATAARDGEGNRDGGGRRSTGGAVEPAVGSTVQRAGKSAVPALTEVSEPDLPAAAAGGAVAASLVPDSEAEEEEVAMCRAIGDYWRQRAAVAQVAALLDGERRQRTELQAAEAMLSAEYRLSWERWERLMEVEWLLSRRRASVPVVDAAVGEDEPHRPGMWSGIPITKSEFPYPADGLSQMDRTVTACQTDFEMYDPLVTCTDAASQTDAMEPGTNPNTECMDAATQTDILVLRVAPVKTAAVEGDSRRESGARWRIEAPGGVSTRGAGVAVALQAVACQTAAEDCTPSGVGGAPVAASGELGMAKFGPSEAPSETDGQTPPHAAPAEAAAVAVETDAGPAHPPCSEIPAEAAVFTAAAPQLENGDQTKHGGSAGHVEVPAPSPAAVEPPKAGEADIGLQPGPGSTADPPVPPPPAPLPEGEGPGPPPRIAVAAPTPGEAGGRLDFIGGGMMLGNVFAGSKPRGSSLRSVSCPIPLPARLTAPGPHLSLSHSASRDGLGFASGWLAASNVIITPRPDPGEGVISPSSSWSPWSAAQVNLQRLTFWGLGRKLDGSSASHSTDSLHQTLLTNTSRALFAADQPHRSGQDDQPGGRQVPPAHVPSTPPQSPTGPGSGAAALPPGPTMADLANALQRASQERQSPEPPGSRPPAAEQERLRQELEECYRREAALQPALMGNSEAGACSPDLWQSPPLFSNPQLRGLDVERRRAADVQYMLVAERDELHRRLQHLHQEYEQLRTASAMAHAAAEQRYVSAVDQTYAVQAEHQRLTAELQGEVSRLRETTARLTEQRGSLELQLDAAQHANAALAARVADLQRECAQQQAALAERDLQATQDSQVAAHRVEEAALKARWATEKAGMLRQEVDALHRDLAAAHAEVQQLRAALSRAALQDARPASPHRDPTALTQQLAAMAEELRTSEAARLDQLRRHTEVRQALDREVARLEAELSVFAAQAAQWEADMASRRLLQGEVAVVRRHTERVELEALQRVWEAGCQSLTQQEEWQRQALSLWMTNGVVGLAHRTAQARCDALLLEKQLLEVQLQGCGYDQLSAKEAAYQAQLELLQEQVNRVVTETNSALWKEFHAAHRAAAAALGREEALAWHGLLAEGRAGRLALERSRVDVEGRMENARLAAQVGCLTAELDRLRADRSATDLTASLEEVKQQLTQMKQHRAATMEADVAERQRLLADVAAWQKRAEELMAQLRTTASSPRIVPPPPEEGRPALAASGLPVTKAIAPRPLSPGSLTSDDLVVGDMSPASVRSGSMSPIFDMFATMPQNRRRQSEREAERQRNSVVAHIMARRHSERERARQLVGPGGSGGPRRSSSDTPPPHSHAPVMVYSTSNLVRSRNFFADQSSGEDISSWWPSCGPLSPILRPEWAAFADIGLALGALVDAHVAYLGFGRSRGAEHLPSDIHDVGDSLPFVNPDTRQRDFWGFLAVHLFRGLQLKLRGVDLPEWVLFCTQSRLAWD